jgi:hypothetical protein
MSEGLFWNGPLAQEEKPKPKLRFVVLDLEALSRNIPRDAAGEVDPEVRAAILASVRKNVDVLLAVGAAEACYYKAVQAYQFGASAYTHQALVSCIGAKAILKEMLTDMGWGAG